MMGMKMPPIFAHQAKIGSGEQGQTPAPPMFVKSNVNEYRYECQ